VALITAEFHGTWRLFVGAAKCDLDAHDIEDALGQIMSRYWPGIQQKLRVRGTKLDGDLLQYSYVVLNTTDVKKLKDRRLKEGDSLHLFLSVPGG
jgi:hypothetical protein